MGGWENFKILVKKKREKERDKDVELKTVEEINQSIKWWKRREEEKNWNRKNGLDLGNLKIIRNLKEKCYVHNIFVIFLQQITGD